jgi:hypothetical protein
LKNESVEIQATFNAKDTVVVTKNATEALADEGTIITQKLEDHVDKKVDSKIDKSFNAKLEKQLEAMRNTINNIAKKSKVGDRKKGQNKKSKLTKK